MWTTNFLMILLYEVSLSNPMQKQSFDKKKITGPFKYCSSLKGLQHFSTPRKGAVRTHNWFFNINSLDIVKKYQICRLVIDKLLILSSYLDLKRFIYFEKRDFFILPAANKVIWEKKMSRVVLKIAIVTKEFNIFLVHEKEQWVFINDFFK